MLTIADIMDQLSVSRSKCYELLKHITHLRIGESIRIRQSALDEYLRSCERRVGTSGSAKE
ncbi:MAG: helix-turn-helix domain-containing protein [Pirellulaceae bacterium]